MLHGWKCINSRSVYRIIIKTLHPRIHYVASLTIFLFIFFCFLNNETSVLWYYTSICCVMSFRLKMNEKKKNKDTERVDIVMFVDKYEWRISVELITSQQIEQIYSDGSGLWGRLSRIISWPFFDFVKFGSSVYLFKWHSKYLDKWLGFFFGKMYVWVFKNLRYSRVILTTIILKEAVFFFSWIGSVTNRL